MKYALAAFAAMLIAPLPAMAHGNDGDFAPVPKGGISWEVLGAAEAMPWTDAGGIQRLAPRFTPEIEALDGREVSVAGFIMPYEDGATAQRFALYADAQDCALHLPPGPSFYVDVSLAEAMPLTSAPIVVRGKLELVRARQGGIFYRMVGAHAVTMDRETAKPVG